MAVYTVHQPPLKKYEAAPDPERFAFVRDGFSFWAFLFGPLWMLRHRMWLVLLGYIVVAVGDAGRACGWSAPPSGGSAFAAFMLALLVGMEAGTLRRFTLGRRRWRNRRHDRRRRPRHGRAAVLRFVGAGRNARAHHAGDAARGRPAAPAQRGASPAPDVIGLFPQPGAHR